MTMSSNTLAKLAYETLQQGFGAFSLAHKELTGKVRRTLSTEPPSQVTIAPETQRELQKSFLQLQKKDWEDAERGVYPIELLFDLPWTDFLRIYPQIWLDYPLIWQRMQKKEIRDFSENIDRQNYPNYYTQNFHYQTDGYLSDTSAELYDLQVELLFNGSADAMRRRILAPLKEGLAKFVNIPQSQQRILDVACGTGLTLKSIRATIPHAKLYGVDLSPTYLRKASKTLAKLPGELPQLLQGAGEELPFKDNYFHAITNVFLFHELPAPIRQKVIEEAYRVLQPGGTLVLCDSIQLIDEPLFEPLMTNFSKLFHEPFYPQYITEDLADRVSQAGFKSVRTERHLMSKYVIATKEG
jgi:ubiquinone/menaquinone biosynthesis C-methylase UbiE